MLEACFQVLPSAQLQRQHSGQGPCGASLNTQSQTQTQTQAQTQTQTQDCGVRDVKGQVSWQQQVC